GRHARSPLVYGCRGLLNNPTIVAYRYLARRAEVCKERVEVYGHAFSNALIMAGKRREGAQQGPS
ncbi:MAG: hypothetical protein OXH50_19770, partial [Gemmatimonadetes bacterium]|nr:hypothetical protein [Gemmatimonadota bacterium]